MVVEPNTPDVDILLKDTCAASCDPLLKFAQCISKQTGILLQSLQEGYVTMRMLTAPIAVMCAGSMIFIATLS